MLPQPSQLCQHCSARRKQKTQKRKHKNRKHESVNVVTENYENYWKTNSFRNVNYHVSRFMFSVCMVPRLCFLLPVFAFSVFCSIFTNSCYNLSVFCLPAHNRKYIFSQLWYTLQRFTWYTIIFTKVFLIGISTN